MEDRQRDRDTDIRKSLRVHQVRWCIVFLLKKSIVFEGTTCLCRFVRQPIQIVTVQTTLSATTPADVFQRFRRLLLSKTSRKLIALFCAADYVPARAAARLATARNERVNDDIDEEVDNVVCDTCDLDEDDAKVLLCDGARPLAKNSSIHKIRIL